MSDSFQITPLNISSSVDLEDININAPVGLARGEKGEPGEQGERGESGSSVHQYSAGMDVLSYKALALIGGQLFHLDASDLSHRHAYIGFSLTAGTAGELIDVLTFGILECSGLTSGQHYLAGANGSLITDSSTQLFSKIIGYAVTPTTLKIIKDSPPIIKH